MTIRCLIDGLLLHAEIPAGHTGLVAYDGDEGFEMEALEVLLYELVSATMEELRQLQEMRYRLLRFASDFRAESVV